ncbi:MAG: DNA-3-methyladenine glycosylase family protein, partial [Polyangiaceae bacterium]
MDARGVRTIYRSKLPLDLARTLLSLARGPYDPCIRMDGAGAIWRATRTPEGPSTTRFFGTSDGVEIESFGAGAAWSIENAPDLLGHGDDLQGFAPKGKLAAIHRANPGIRITRTKAVYEAAIRSICEQLVTGREAQRAFAKLTRTFGEKAPGPVDLWVPPLPKKIARLTYGELHPCGLEAKRALTLREVARTATSIEKTSAMPIAEAYRLLAHVKGIGPWTLAEIAVAAWGDADAVSVGDFHLKNTVVYAFTGAPRGTDAEMLELLEPYRPHRARVIKLIEAARIRAPRFGA